MKPSKRLQELLDELGGAHQEVYYGTPDAAALVKEREQAILSHLSGQMAICCPDCFADEVIQETRRG